MTKATRYTRGFVSALLLIVIILFAFLIVGGLFSKKKNGLSSSNPVSSYTCCDSGDGDACKVSDTEKFMWKGTNDQPEEYALIKSNIALLEKYKHIAPADPPDDKTPKGERIFLNTGNKDFPNGYTNIYSPGSNDACKIPGQDFVFKKHEGLICQGIPNDEIIYVCKSRCEGRIGEGKFDAYFRVKDGPIPDVIKNCEKPKGAGTGSGGQKIVEPTNDPRKNLQLNTFKVIEENTPADWLSPYCKPAIYLYPESTSLVNVRVESPYTFLYTNPVYPASGWNVIADPTGNIFHQNTFYDYLYYETQVPDSKVEKPKEGYVVERSGLPSLFANLLPKLGLNTKETMQFSDYWLNALPNSPYYFVGIVNPLSLDALTSLSINPTPKTIIRVTLYFEALNKKVDVAKPSIKTPNRTGFTVVEWGGIYKRDKNSNFSCLQ